MNLQTYPKDRKIEIILFLIPILAGSIFLSFFYPAYHDRFWTSDSQEYKTLSQNYIEHGIYSLDETPPLRPSISYPPLYPTFLALASFQTFSLLAILASQIVLLGGISVIIYKLSLEMFQNKNAAILSAVLFSLEPATLFFTNQIYPEALFTFFFVTSLFFILRYVNRGNLLQLVPAGISIGLATLTRPNGEYLAYLSFVFLIVASIRDKRGAQKTLLSAVIFLFLFFAALSPWLMRSYKIFGSFVNSSTGYYTLATRTLPSYFSWKENISMTEAQAKAKELLISRGVKREALEEYDFSIDRKIPLEAAKIVLADPFGFAKSQVRFLIPYFFGTGWSEIFKVFAGDESNPPYFISNPGSSIFSRIKEMGSSTAIILSISGAAFYALIYCFFIYALFKILRENKNAAFALFLCAIIFYFALSTGELSYSRYRYPVNPLIFIIASFGIAYLWNYFRNREALPPLRF